MTSLSINARFCRTPADFEEAAADWLRTWGYEDAIRTPTGPDSGADVIGTGLVAQVKAWMTPVGRPEIQQLKGVAFDGRTAVFFSLMAFTNEAVGFADQSGVALFRFSGYDGSVEPANDHARSLIQLAQERADARSGLSDDETDEARVRRAMQELRDAKYRNAEALRDPRAMAERDARIEERQRRYGGN
jgi:Restriction endonuclease